MEVYGKQDIIVTTLSGLENALEKELNLLGITHTEVINRGVAIPYSKRNLYLANMACRVAMRVLVPVFSFEANDTEQLYKMALQLKWEKFQDVEQTFAIYNAINSTVFKHSQYASLKIKDALCDRFRKIHNRRPDVDTRSPEVFWHLHIYENKVTISLDSSGTSLHIRGYRRGHHGAPINEVLACGLLYLSGWDGTTPFVDGMTGSGTIAIEAAMMAGRRAPNLNRRNFPFRKWKDDDDELFQSVRKELTQNVRNNVPEIVGIDISPRAIETAEVHAKLAGVSKLVRFKKGDFLDYKPQNNKGVLLLNPPYGERMEVDDLNLLYKEIGTTFKHSFPGWKAGIISSSKEALNSIGLNSYDTRHLLNGKLECDFKLYELFEGKKKKLEDSSSEA
ncbi:MAG: THUMP domain-containing protein [Chitinophagales bacterium]|nr:THUMP domain-containing protein [Chitinophagales bacterium]